MRITLSEFRMQIVDVHVEGRLRAPCACSGFAITNEWLYYCDSYARRHALGLSHETGDPNAEFP